MNENKDCSPSRNNPKQAPLYRMKGSLHSYESKQIPPSYLDNIFLNVIKELEPKSKILDIGSGKGEIASFAKEHRQEAISMDLFKVGLLDLKKRDPAAEALIGSGIRLPFADNSFDLVHAKDMLVHIKNQGELLAEVFRILKPGGKIMLLSVDSSGSVPGYYFTSSVKTERLMREAKFSKLEYSVYKPKLREFKKDWYGLKNIFRGPTTRHLFKGEKIVDTISSVLN